MNAIVSCRQLVAAALVCLPAMVNAFPTKTIRIIVPFAPGGANDLTARSIGQKLTAAMGQPVVVENRGGAGGTIGMDLVARSQADGHTLVMGSASSLTVAPSLYSKLSYDPVRDFAPISNIAAGPYALTLHPSVPAKSVKEFIALAQAKRGSLNFASSGPGSMSHLATEILKASAKIDMTNVSYKGTAPAIIELLGGHVDLMIADLAVVMPHSASGRLRVLAVTSETRTALAPKLPTIAESGLPGYIIVNWRGMLAPGTTPREVVAKLNAEIVKAVKSADLRESLVNEGYEPIGDTPDQFASLIKAEVSRYAKAIKAAGIPPI